MAAAHYTIYVPAQDELRRPLRLHEAVHEHLLNQGADPVQTNFGHPHNTIHAWAESTPEWDGLIKQTGTLAAELANTPAIYVTKDGDKSAKWAMRNNNYQAMMGAHPSALSSPARPPI